MASAGIADCVLNPAVTEDRPVRPCRDEPNCRVLPTTDRSVLEEACSILV